MATHDRRLETVEDAPAEAGTPFTIGRDAVYWRLAPAVDE